MRQKTRQAKRTTVPSAGQAPARTAAEMKYAKYLEREFDARSFASKGERTRFRLKIAAAHVLEEIGFQDCTVADVCRRAGVALGTFYVYFTDKCEIAREILLEFQHTLHDQVSQLAHHRDDFEAILTTNRFFVDAYRCNPGLLRCSSQLEDQDPVYRARRREHLSQWTARIAGSIRRRTGQPESAQNQSLQMASALEGMVYQYLYDVFVKRDPSIGRRIARSDNIAELLSVLWYRAVYCENPPADALSEPTTRFWLHNRLRSPAARP